MKKVLIIGSGKSGKAAEELLKEKAETFIWDDKMDESLKPNVSDFDELLISPGVPIFHPMVLESEKLGIRVTGELELAYENCKGEFIAITGTNGKTTCTTLLKKIAYDNGIIPAEHNLANMQGNAEYIPILQSRLDADVAILEVGTFGVSGTVDRTCNNSDMEMALMTNITPDHLSKGFLDYAKVKGEIIQSLNGKKIIVNCQDPTIMGLIKQLDYQGEVITFGLDWTPDKVGIKQCVCGEEIKVIQH